MKRYRLPAFLLTLFLLLASTYCVAVFTDWVPPLSRLRDQCIETALGTMNHQWLATALFPGDIVAEVQREMDAAREAQFGKNSSSWNTEDFPQKPDFFGLFPEIDPAAFRAWASVPEEELENFYVNYAGLDEVGLDLSTRQGDQVLAIDAACPAPRRKAGAPPASVPGTLPGRTTPSSLSPLPALTQRVPRGHTRPVPPCAAAYPAANTCPRATSVWS